MLEVRVLVVASGGTFTHAVHFCVQGKGPTQNCLFHNLSEFVLNLIVQSIHLLLNRFLALRR